MNPTLITDLLTYALPSGFLAGAVTWLVSRRKRRNDMLADMQRSIDLLCEKYNDVLQENVTLRREKADWLVAQQEPAPQNRQTHPRSRRAPQKLQPQNPQKNR